MCEPRTPMLPHGGADRVNVTPPAGQRRAGKAPDAAVKRAESSVCGDGAAHLCCAQRYIPRPLRRVRSMFELVKLDAVERIVRQLLSSPAPGRARSRQRAAVESSATPGTRGRAAPAASETAAWRRPALLFLNIPFWGKDDVPQR